MASRVLVDNESEEGEEQNELSQAKKVDTSKDDNDSDYDAYDAWKRQNIIDEEFLGACERNDLGKVKFLLDQGADVNYWTNIDDETGLDVFDYGLKYAATRNYPELCDLLLAHPDIDVDNLWYDTGPPLKLAVDYGHTEIVRKLVKAPGIDLNQQSDDGGYAALSAVHSPLSHDVNLEIVKILSETEGVDWNLEDDYGRTAFMMALELPGKKGVRCLKLLRNVPSIDWNHISTSDFDVSPFCWSLSNESTKIPRFLLTLPDVQVDVGELRDNKGYYEKAMDICKLFVTNKMKKYTISNEDRRMNSIFDLLLFSLQKNLSSNIVDLLTSALTTLDIVEIVIYKNGAAKDDQRNLSSKAAYDSKEENSLSYKVKKQSNDEQRNVSERVNDD